MTSLSDFASKPDDTVSDLARFIIQAMQIEIISDELTDHELSVTFQAKKITKGIHIKNIKVVSNKKEKAT